MFLRHERHVGAEAVGGAGLVDPDCLLRRQGRFDGGDRVAFQHHPAAIALHQGVQRRRVAVLLPDQVLGHGAELVVAGPGSVEGALQSCLQRNLAEMGLDEMQQVLAAGLHPVGLIGQQRRVHPYRRIFLVVTLGVARHRLGRNLDEGIAHTEPGQQLAFHGAYIGLFQGAGGNHAQQADAGVGIGPVGARGVLRLPGAVVIRQLSAGADAIRQLQGKAAGGVGGQVDQRHLVESAALEFRQVAAGAFGELELAEGFGVGDQGDGQSLADRADFEKRLAGDRLLRRPGRHAEVVEALLAPGSERDGHAGNAVLLHDLASRLPDAGIEAGRLGAGHDLTAEAGRQCKQEYGCVALSCRAHREGPSVMNGWENLPPRARASKTRS
ncbi:hypothetical protein D9M72_454740 [compost metagenome]